MPVELARRCVEASTSPAGCCAHCRTPWRRVVQKGSPDLARQRACGADATGQYAGQALKDYAAGGAQNASEVKRRILEGMVEKTTLGFRQGCSCETELTQPCLVLDPFSGAGTTALAAQQLGRDAVGVELNPEYIEIARQRLGGAIDFFLWGF